MRVTLIRRLRRLSVLGMSMCVALIGVACTTISPERPYPVEQQTLRVAARASVDVVPLRLGVRRGFFREEGLQLRFVKQPTDAGVLRAVMDGTADVGLVSNYLMLRRAAEGTRFEVQGEAYTCGPNTMALVALPGHGYEVPTDKPDPIIGVEPGRPFGELATRMRLSTEGVDPDDITFVELGFSAMMDALQSGKVDAVWMTEPNISRAQKEHGAEIIMDTARGALMDFPLSSYVAPHHRAHARPETYAAFRRALVRSQALAADGAAVRSELSKLTGLDRTTTQMVALGTFPTSLNEGRLQRVADLLHRSGVVAERIAVVELLPGRAAS